jgi:hypothetical protein
MRWSIVIVWPFALHAALPQEASAQVEDDYALPGMTGQARDSNWVACDANYAFRDGIYYDHAAFRNNKPSIPKAILLTRDHDPLSDFKRYRYIDSVGVEHRIMQDSVWGFALKDHVYIRSYVLPLGAWSSPTDEFLQLRIMGTISHMIITVRQNYVDPGMMGAATTQVQQVQLLFKVATGESGNTSAATIYSMITDDEELKREFEALPKRKRNDELTIFQFMRRYNERNPLYFPK